MQRNALYLDEEKNVHLMFFVLPLNYRILAKFLVPGVMRPNYSQNLSE